MKKSLLLFILACQALLTVAQSNRPGYAIAITRFKLFYNDQQVDSLYGMFSPRMKTALPLPKIREMFSSLHTQLGKLNSTKVDKETDANVIYRGVFEKAELNIILTLNEKNELGGLFFTPVKEGEEVGKKPDTSNFVIRTNKGTSLYGSLEVPANIQVRSDVVLIIAGSGPTDRNGNSTIGIKTDAYKMLADSLKKAGIASVRYDKRGVGESMTAAGTESELRFDDMVDDAVRMIKRIKDDGRFAKVFILGHSEGSLIGMVAAQRESVNGFISLAGAGEPADETIKRQIKTNMSNKSKEADKILDQLKKNKTVEIDDEQLKEIFRPSVQPYLSSWFAYDPRQEIRKITIPTLIIQGTTDLQVGVRDAELLKKARPDAQLHLIPDMNHVLKTASADVAENRATYNNPSLPLVKVLSDEIIAFCRAQQQNKE